MSAPRPSETDPFHPLGSITSTPQFRIYIQKCTRYFFHVVRLVWCAFRNCACALTGTLTLRFFVISKAILTSIRFCWCDMTFAHAHCVNKRNRPLFRAFLLNFSYLFRFCCLLHASACNRSQRQNNNPDENLSCIGLEIRIMKLSGNYMEQQSATT